MKHKINKKLIIILFLFLLSLLIGIMVYNGNILEMDTLAYNLIVEKLRSPTLTTIMKFITKLGNPNTIIVLCLLSSAIVFPKNKQLSMIIPLNLIFITCFNQMIKLVVKRPRPTGYRLIDIDGYSFPSGHAMVGLAFYGLLVYIIYRTVKNKKLKIVLTTLVLITIFLIGLSRVYLGVHFLSDILVGYFSSTIYLLIVTNLIDKYILNKSQNIP